MEVHTLRVLFVGSNSVDLHKHFVHANKNVTSHVAL